MAKRQIRFSLLSHFGTDHRGLSRKTTKTRWGLVSSQHSDVTRFEFHVRHMVTLMLGALISQLNQSNDLIQAIFDEIKDFKAKAKADYEKLDDKLKVVIEVLTF